MRWPGLIVIVIAGCVPAGPRPAVPWKEGAKASEAVLDGAAARPWIRITPQGTSMCVRLPDGSFHHVVYGVGGSTDGFVFHPSVPVPATRDVDCSDYGVTTLGEGGVVSSFLDGKLHPADVQPEARAMHVGPGWTCFLSDAGVAWCGGSTRPAFDIGALGPAAEFVGDDCVRYRDGKVACRAPGSTPPYAVLWTDAKQATSVGGVRCAVLASGQVSCMGDNRFGQRGFSGAVGAEPTLVPGLDHVDEVHTSGTHVCARRGGEVWCWGQAGEGQAGEVARERSTAWPKCAVDEARTAQAKRDHEAAVATCRGPRPPGDDPFCRAVSGSYVSTIFVGNPGYDCDPAGAIRFAPPTRVEELSDAVALATRGSMTCALRAERTLVCWGAGASEPKSLAIAAGGTPVEAVYQRPARGPSLVVNEWGVLVHGATGAFTFHAWKSGALGKPQRIDGAIDVTLAPGVCTLAAGGAVACEAAFDSPASTVTAPPGFDRFAGRGRGCFAGPSGAIGCLPGSGEPWAARLTAAGPVVDAQSGCALHADGVVRCFETRGGQRTDRLVDVIGDVVSLAEPLWPLTMCAVKRAGDVWCVGGEFDPMRAPPPAPVAIAGAPPSVAVAAAYQHACVLAADATVWCWGRSVEGQVGPGAARKVDVTPAPVQVPGVTDVIAIGAGRDRSCALTRNGELRCWGNGSPKVQTVAAEAP